MTRPVGSDRPNHLRTRDEQRLDSAFSSVAVRVICDLAEHYLPQAWESYPDISDADWEHVVDEVSGILHDLRADNPHYDVAYDLLTQRANQPKNAEATQ